MCTACYTINHTAYSWLHIRSNKALHTVLHQIVCNSVMSYVIIREYVTGCVGVLMFKKKKSPVACTTEILGSFMILSSLRFWTLELEYVG